MPPGVHVAAVERWRRIEPAAVLRATGPIGGTVEEVFQLARDIVLVDKVTGVTSTDT